MNATPRTPAAGSGAAAVPFVRAAYEHVEALSDNSFTLTGSTQLLGPIDISAYGYLRNIVIAVDTTTAATGAVTTGPDYPFQMIKELTLIDVNGAPIVGPLSGWDLACIDAFGGYVFLGDPRQNSDYVNGALQTNFILRIPVECTPWDGYCSLANQNAATTYKLRVTVNGTSDAQLYTSAPATTQATIRVRTYLEAWSQPLPTDAFGHPQATTPPRNGSTQFWSKFSKTNFSGQTTIILPRVGNVLRNLILVNRLNASGSRGIGGPTATLPAAVTPAPTTSFPATFEYRLDSRQRLVIDRTHFDRQMSERHNFNKHVPVSGSAEFTGGTQALTRPAGSYDDVYVLDFTHDATGKGGFENRHLWVPTLQSTRLELAGNWTAATILDMLTNDIAPAPASGPKA